MLETAEVGARIGKKEYEEALPPLRVDLLNAQFEIRNADFPVVILLSGDDHEGLSEVLNLLHAWMDARYLDAHFFEAQKEEERGYPRFWRYWQVLPGTGQIGVYAGSFGLGLVADHLTGWSRPGGWSRRWSMTAPCCSSSGFTCRPASGRSA